MASYRDQLARDSRAWVAEGVLTEDQRAAILARTDRDARASALVLLALVGAAVVVLGVTLIVAANWDEVGRATRIAIGIALMVALYVAGYRVRFHHGLARTGSALLVIGSSAFLANLALVSQQYHVGTMATILLIFSVGSLAVAYVLPSRLHGALAGMALAAWVPVRGGDNLSDALRVASQPVGLVSVAAIVLLAGALHRATRFRELAGPLEATGAVLLLAAVYLLGFLRHTYERDVGEFGRRIALPRDVVVEWLVRAAVPAVLLAVGVVRLRREALPPRAWRALHAASAALTATVLWALVTLLSAPDRSERLELLLTIGFWALALALAVSLAWLGVAFDEARWRTTALAFIGLFVMTRYFDLFDDGGRRGVTFVVAGAVLLVLAALLERSRRALTAATGGAR
jgi:uncharacterized membrane protein